jgi:hypothetical protein
LNTFQKVNLVSASTPIRCFHIWLNFSGESQAIWFPSFFVFQKYKIALLNCLLQTYPEISSLNYSWILALTGSDGYKWTGEWTEAGAVVQDTWIRAKCQNWMPWRLKTRHWGKWMRTYFSILKAILYRESQHLPKLAKTESIFYRSELEGECTLSTLNQWSAIRAHKEIKGTCRKARSQIVLIYRWSELTLKRPWILHKNLLDLIAMLTK